MVHVGRTLRALRLKHDMSASALARKAGLTPGAVGDAERSEFSIMRTSTLKRVLAAFSETHESFMCSVAAGWWGDEEGWIRGRILLALHSADADQLLSAHHVLQGIVGRAAAAADQVTPPAGGAGTEAPLGHPLKDNRRRVANHGDA